VKEIVFTRRFEHDFRRLKRRLSPHVLDYETLEYVFELLQRRKSLPQASGSGLEGEYAGFTECHIDADWLLVYRVTRSRIVFHRTGTHRDLFRPRTKRPRRET
jgi:mRNA interferase YafQ